MKELQKLSLYGQMAKFVHKDGKTKGVLSLVLILMPNKDL